MRPFLPNIEVNKDGNNSGCFIASEVTGTKSLRIDFTASLPISKTNAPPSTKEDFKSDTLRQHTFEAICHALRLAHDGETTPYRFTDKNHNEWNLDSSSAFWLLQTDRWQPTEEDLASPDLMLRFIG